MRLFQANKTNSFQSQLGLCTDMSRSRKGNNQPFVQNWTTLKDELTLWRNEIKENQICSMDNIEQFQEFYSKLELQSKRKNLQINITRNAK